MLPTKSTRPQPHGRLQMREEMLLKFFEIARRPQYFLSTLAVCSHNPTNIRVFDSRTGELPSHTLAFVDGILFSEKKIKSPRRSHNISQPYNTRPAAQSSCHGRTSYSCARVHTYMYIFCARCVLSCDARFVDRTLDVRRGGRARDVGVPCASTQLPQFLSPFVAGFEWPLVGGGGGAFDASRAASPRRTAAIIALRFLLPPLRLLRRCHSTSASSCRTRNTCIYIVQRVGASSRGCARIATKTRAHVPSAYTWTQAVSFAPSALSRAPPPHRTPILYARNHTRRYVQTSSTRRLRLVTARETTYFRQARPRRVTCTSNAFVSVRSTRPVYVYAYVPDCYRSRTAHGFEDRRSCTRALCT